MSRPLFSYRDEKLLFNGHVLETQLAARDYAHPFYLYDLGLVEERLAWLKTWEGLGRLHFALKANYSVEVMRLILEYGGGLDVVSVGEIHHALDVGFKPKDLIFSGVAKTKDEISWAIKNEIYQINVESFSELQRVHLVALELKKKVNIGLRLNPEVDGKTHPYIATALKDSKFGIAISELPRIVEFLEAAHEIVLKAVSFHIGSQITAVEVYEEAIKKIRPYFVNLQRKFPTVDRLDLGGGLGLDYRDHDLEKDFGDWQKLKKIYMTSLAGIKAQFLLEMGRFIVARSAVLVSQVQYVKQTQTREIVILDVGMNNLLRPMLYKAYHKIYPLTRRQTSKEYCVVGPICESSDVFHESIKLTEIKEGDLVLIADVGAYAKSMSSNYNLQPIAKDYFL